jgi:predicted ATPase
VLTRFAAQAQAETVIAHCTEQGFALFAAMSTILRGWALAAQGQNAAGHGQMHQGLATFRATGTELIQAYFLSLLAEVYGNAGQADAGLTILEEALAVVDTSDERIWEAELYRRKGELLLMHSMNYHAEVEIYLRCALDIARSQHMKSLELRAASLSRLWQQQGKCDAAKLLLAEVYDWFTEGFDTADLREAKALLEG